MCSLLNSCVSVRLSKADSVWCGFQSHHISLLCSVPFARNFPCEKILLILSFQFLVSASFIGFSSFWCRFYFIFSLWIHVFYKAWCFRLFCWSKFSFFVCNYEIDGIHGVVFLVMPVTTTEKYAKLIVQVF